MGASILYAAAVIGIVGILAGILLGVASEKFKVKVDEKEIKVREALPGNNCGGCGYPGCDGLAAAIAKGEAKPDACPVGGEAVAKKIVEIVGGEIDSVRHVAHVKCAGTCEKAKDAYDYVGPEDCQIAANAPGGGPRVCLAQFRRTGTDCIYRYLWTSAEQKIRDSVGKYRKKQSLPDDDSLTMELLSRL